MSLRVILASTLAVTGLFGTSIVGQLPMLAGLESPAIAQTVDPAKKDLVKLNLVAAKRVIEGEKVKLQPIAANSKVQPGDTIVYSLTANNTTDRGVKKLVLTQPVPKGTSYVANSATVLKGAQLIFSIDNGKTFSAVPMIKDKPAPASSYTHIRWRFTTDLAAKSQINTSYAVNVR